MRKPKAVLIVGGSGFIGSHLCRKLRDGFKVYATYHKYPIPIAGVTWFPCDASERDWVKRVVYTCHPDIVIFVAGKNDPALAEEDSRETDKIHSSGAVNIATTAGILQPRFIFLSNCYTFDGRRGNYHETDICLPIYQLGKAKLSSEKYYMGSSNYVIVRSSPVYGRGVGTKLTFLDRLRMKLERGEKVEVTKKSIHSFAPVEGLVDLLVKLAGGGPKNTILHYGGLTKITDLEFARAFAKHFKYDEKLILALQTYQGEADDPPEFDFSMNSTKTVEAMKIKCPLLEEGLELFHKNLVEANRPG